MSFSRVIQPRKGWLWGLQAHAHNRFAVCAAFTKIIMAAPGGPLNFLWDQDKENPPPRKSLLSYSTSVSFCSLSTFKFNLFRTSPVGREDVGLLSWV